MASERLAPDAIAASANLSGAVSAVQDDPDSPDASWLTAPDNNSDASVRVTFPTPSGGEPSGTQNFRVRVRRKAGQSGTPTARIELWQSGSLVATVLADTSVSSTSGQVLQGNWDASILSDLTGAGVECQVYSVKTGGSPSTRNVAEVGAIEWNAEVQPALEQHTASSSLAAGAAIAQGVSTGRTPSSSLSASAVTSYAISSARQAGSALSALAALSEQVGSSRSVGSGLAAAASITESASASEEETHTTTSGLSAQAVVSQSASTERVAASALAAAASVDQSPASARSHQGSLSAAVSVSAEFSTSRVAASALSAEARASGSAGTEREASSSLSAAAAITQSATGDGGEAHVTTSSLSAQATIASSAGTDRSATSTVGAGATVTELASTARSVSSTVRAAASVSGTPGTGRAVASALVAAATIAEAAARVEGLVDIWRHGAIRRDVTAEQIAAAMLATDPDCAGQVRHLTRLAAAVVDHDRRRARQLAEAAELIRAAVDAPATEVLSDLVRERRRAWWRVQ